MYNVAQYGRMVADDLRMDAYARALRQAVGPESVVLDIGAGTGIMSFLACRYGARKVYAVEPSDAIAVARKMAVANGFADRIEFMQDLSTRISLPEKADVIVADLRGVLPLFQKNVPSMADARERLLADGGTMIPLRDTLWAAIVEAPEAYEKVIGPWAENQYGLDMRAAREIVTNSWDKGTMQQDQFLAEPRCWGTIDYVSGSSVNFASTIDFDVMRPGTAHGLAVWFDSVLAEGIEFSNAPGRPKMIYGSGFFPWTAATHLTIGDRASVHLRADLTGDEYVWGWESKVYNRSSEGPRLHFRQSTFFGAPFSSERLRKRAAGYRASLNEDGRIDRLILERMDGAIANEEIARELMEQFPVRFGSLSEALTRVGLLSDRYCLRTAGRG